MAAATKTPSVGDLTLLVGDHCLAPGMLDELPDTDTLAAPCDTARTIAAAVPDAAAVRAALQRRRMNRLADATARRTDGCIVYRETNMIARPFDGATVVTVHDRSRRADCAGTCAGRSDADGGADVAREPARRRLYLGLR